MALGGGTYLVQNKLLPGAYINFVSASRASATLSDRGTATFPLSLDWGPEGEVFTVENADFQRNSLKLFGHAYTDDALRPLREIFANAQTLHVFRLNTGGVKASCKYADAKYPGTVGNSLKIVIAKNEAFETTENEVYDVSTYIGATQVDIQKAVKTVSDLQPNDYVTWKGSEALAESAGITLTSGTNGTVQDAAYQTYLDKIEPYSFNVMGCDTTDETVKGLFANFVKRLRDEQGVKFQLVLFRYPSADFEGVISVKNGLVGADTNPSMVYWTTGAEAACAVNKSLTNATYTGEYSPDVVTGLITRITTPDGRASAFYYNHHSQLTSATGPDGLELRREYDESGRLIQETAPDGDITRYRYDNPHSDLPCATEDATGSRKTIGR